MDNRGKQLKVKDPREEFYNGLIEYHFKLFNERSMMGPMDRMAYDYVEKQKQYEQERRGVQGSKNP